MKKIFTILSIIFMLIIQNLSVFAITEPTITYTLAKSQKIRDLEVAFIFDGPSDKNNEVLKTFKDTIQKSLLPDYKAIYSEDLIFVGNWDEKSVREVTEKALNSRATTVVSLGYLSSIYLENKKNVSKFIFTINEYGLRELGSDAFFNPIKQYVNHFILFKKLVPNQNRTAILINENFYKTQKDWHSVIDKKFKEKNHVIDFVVLPVSSSNLLGSLAKIPSNVDSVFITPMFNLSIEQRKELYNYLNSKKIYTFSSIGQEDVKLGALLGSSTPDVDRKLAEAASFSIRGVLRGQVVKKEKIPFFDDEVIFYNQDTAKILGYSAPLRLLNNAEIITSKQKTKYDLTYIFETMETNNLDIKRKKYLVDAARRSAISACLRYLPTLRIDLGHQSYNDSYSESYTNVPRTVGQFTIGLEQVIYSPDLVTNIIVKNKKINFDKAEKVLTEQNTGLSLAFLYIDTLKFENMIKVQEEFVLETRENLAIARVREKAGKCGREEVLRWAGQVSESEKKLLNMKADHKNLLVAINQMLHKDQTEDFSFKPLTAHDPAFLTSDLHVIDHVSSKEKLEKFTTMLIKEAIDMAPETAKLKAAIAMKKAEMSNYAQKFVMPNAKIQLDFGRQFDRDLPYESSGHYPAAGMYPSPSGPVWNQGPYIGLNESSTRLMLVAQWKPIEGGHKIAEIARCKSELNELNAHMAEVHVQIERQIREVVNRAIAKYFLIEKSYKAMFAESENYKLVKDNYARGIAPISQLVDAQNLYSNSKVDALNSQYDFFSELIWIQRAIISTNWTKAQPRAKKWVNEIPYILPAEPDFTL